MRMLRTLGLVALATVLWPADPASAQPLGSYRWQLQPYCNVIQVAVVQQGGQYQLHGTDDQCSPAVKPSVVGLAFQNPNGLIGFGLTIVTAPGGTPVHVDATISIITLSGTWHDSAGNSGTFIFTPGAGIGGGPRPLPSGGLAPSSVTTIQIAPAAVTAAQIANEAVTSASIADGAITTADLAAPPQLQFLTTLSNTALTAAVTTIRSITVNAPTAGRVMVTVSGNFQMTSAAPGDTVQCSLTTGAAIESAGRVEARTNFVGTTYVPFSITRVFNVPAGAFTANRNCHSLGGTMTPYEVQTTALFIGS